MRREYTERDWQGVRREYTEREGQGVGEGRKKWERFEREENEEVERG